MVVSDNEEKFRQHLANLHVDSVTERHYQLLKPEEEYVFSHEHDLEKRCLIILEYVRDISGAGQDRSVLRPLGWADLIETRKNTDDGKGSAA